MKANGGEDAATGRASMSMKTGQPTTATGSGDCAMAGAITNTEVEQPIRVVISTTARTDTERTFIQMVQSMPANGSKTDGTG